MKDKSRFIPKDSEEWKRLVHTNPDLAGQYGSPPMGSEEWVGHIAADPKLAVEIGHKRNIWEVLVGLLTHGDPTKYED